jgi:hypothetical protein
MFDASNIKKAFVPLMNVNLLKKNILKNKK